MIGAIAGESWKTVAGLTRRPTLRETKLTAEDPETECRNASEVRLSVSGKALPTACTPIEIAIQTLLPPLANQTGAVLENGIRMLQLHSETMGCEPEDANPYLTFPYGFRNHCWLQLRRSR